MLKNRIDEELTKAEVRSIVRSVIDDTLKEKDFEKRVNELTAKSMERFFKMMYNRRNFWQNEIKNG